MRQCIDCKCNITAANTYRRVDRPGKLPSRCKSCYNKYCSSRWIKRKLDVITLLGNKCIDCDKSYHYAVYDLHHVDPNSKVMQWNKMRLVSSAKLKAEVSKCILLCSNCHRVRHSTN